MTNEQASIIAGFALKFGGLGIKGKFQRLEEGPVITGYYFTLDASVPLAKILNKSEDFAMAARAESVLIERVGGEIAIYVPNRERKLIDFKDSLHYIVTVAAKSQELPITLGVDSLGRSASLDLAEMPHILLAGETGSGKSVYESAVLASLAVAIPPEKLHLYLCDTKQLDLPLFRQLPHVKDVITNVRGFHKTADWILKTIRSRMDDLKAVSVRNIQEFNKGGFGNMPYIVFMIDEFADLIKQDEDLRKSDKKRPKDEREFDETPDVRGWLLRIVQISRAAGVHVIAGTQRSSVKIVDGDIKANFPCRVALRLPTAVDSGTILGEGGAESLLGKGDMLVLRPSKDRPERFHGPFVQLTDIQNVVYASSDIRQMYESMTAL